MWDCEQFLNVDEDHFLDVDKDEYRRSRDSSHSEEEHTTTVNSLGTIKVGRFPSSTTSRHNGGDAATAFEQELAER
ncbi:hypothetical protein V9T40_013705 [Parthenolecanium corni]|uniref:Uncharacterized protein n=1 Tax=Parthenolecanium corni TaxID=536013 RepID=A0AAN9TPJ1_9HEMI